MDKLKGFENIPIPEVVRRYGSQHDSAIIIGNVIKYASLLTGVYSVCKEEIDFVFAIAAGVVYVLGDLIRNIGTDINEIGKFSALEESIKKTIKEVEVVRIENKPKE